MCEQVPLVLVNFSEFRIKDMFIDAHLLTIFDADKLHAIVVWS